MIDIANAVFTALAPMLRDEFKANVTSEYVKEPAKFPHVSIVESDNYVTVRNVDSSGKEKFATVMYEINVYSNKQSGKKSECRAIMSKIDETLYSLGFTRLSMTPVPNLEDATIYRLTARYRAETDGQTIYRI